MRDPDRHLGELSLLEFFAYAESEVASCGRCRRDPRRSFDDEGTYLVIVEERAEKASLEEQLATFSKTWVRSVGDYPDGVTEEPASAKNWCRICKDYTAPLRHRKYLVSCPILVIAMTPSTRPRTDVFAEASGLRRMELNKMDCSKRFRCGVREYDPVALVIDNCDIYGQHVSYLVLVRYKDDWFSAHGSAVSRVPSVGKDAVVMVWAVRVEATLLKVEGGASGTTTAS